QIEPIVDQRLRTLIDQELKRFPIKQERFNKPY
ncbi:unnamed protein product, partial [Rotaria sordida]